MHTHNAQPTAKRVLSLLWFPFFFAAAFALLGILAFAHPEPHDVRVGVVADSMAQEVTTGLPAGIELIPVSNATRARGLVASGDLAGAIDDRRLFVASAASSTRADYLTAIFTPRLGADAAVTDVRPLAPGDVSGVGLFFYALPNLLVGLITSIVLLQFGMWPLRKKVATIAATGLFSALFSYLLATSLNVIPDDARLILYAFVLAQAIGWLTTAAALYAKQFFMPVAMTFVLILGIPSSGATVNADMLPPWIRLIGDWHPFAQFIDLARADAYLDAGDARPLAVLLGWAALGAVLLVLYRVREKRQAAETHRQAPAAESAMRTELRGCVESVSGVSVAGATVIILTERGEKWAESRTDAEGEYSAEGMTAGTYYVLVAADHVDPSLGTLQITGHAIMQRFDMTVTDWNDPANITAENE